MLAAYASLPGTTLAAPLKWPAETAILRSERAPTLLVFAHPRCPCTRATLGELEKIVARYGDSLATWVVFLKPGGSDAGWDNTELLKTAAAIPHVGVIRDLDGVEAGRFQATTSGQALLYSEQGDLEFCGGITVARGHAGDSAGREAIEAILSRGPAGLRQTPVFGCPIAAAPEPN